MDGDILKLPPHNVEAERYLLGSLLMDPDRLIDVAPLISPGDFYRDSHGILFHAIASLHAEGIPVHPLTLAERLTAAGQFESVGGHDGLLALLSGVPHAANAVYFAGVVRQKALTRRFIDLCQQSLRAAYSLQSTADDLMGELQSGLLCLQETGSRRGAVRFARLGPLVFEAILRRTEQGEVTGLSTGFPDLDVTLGGLQPEQLVILAARPSAGKTSLALNICEHVAVNLRTPVLFVTLEMGEEALVERMIVSRSRIDGGRARAGFLNREAIEKARIATRELADSDVLFDGSASSLMLVLSAARGAALRDRVGLIVLDYLQLIEPEGGRDSRQEQVAKISRQLKTLARQIRVPVLALSQLNRSPELRPDKRPRMSDLRESGGIENDADIVMLLHRPEYYDPDDQPGVAELIVAKNRNGATGTVKLAFHKESMRFDLLDERIY